MVLMSREEYNEITNDYFKNRSKTAAERDRRLGKLYAQFKNGQFVSAKDVLYALEEGFLVDFYKKFIVRLFDKYSFSISRFSPPMPLPSQLALVFVFFIGTLFQMDTRLVDNAIIDSYNEYDAILPAILDMGCAKTPDDVEKIYAILECLADVELYPELVK